MVYVVDKTLGKSYQARVKVKNVKDRFDMVVVDLQ